MTIEQFNNQQFGKGMRGEHVDNGKGRITGVDFSEKLIEMKFDDPAIIGYYLCRCENVTILEGGK